MASKMWVEHWAWSLIVVAVLHRLDDKYSLLCILFGELHA